MAKVNRNLPDVACHLCFRRHRDGQTMGEDRRVMLCRAREFPGRGANSIARLLLSAPGHRACRPLKSCSRVTLHGRWSEYGKYGYLELNRLAKKQLPLTGIGFSTSDSYQAVQADIKHCYNAAINLLTRPPGYNLAATTTDRSRPIRSS